ncbi:saxitoxin and tetrodotoxin-binding protein 1-like [Seriola lalandi dorsalis]|uniref:saxitoxin and tetrodotoxin-binding protein 1-like n=1 Tax=Seriola lalandi dorsalis TaxID=1841481 RepID=UPI000C6F616C|nr:saxitoxin and tetrodotoxin-binding protein 1-like [Seriola lalandi dorsalis]
MCCVVKQTVLLLLLAAIGCNAAPAADECEGLHKTLPAKDLHTIFGDWVLVWSVSDHQQGSDLLQNLSSSHVELRLLPDNTTIMFNERNVFIDGSCSNFIINMSMPSDPTSDEHHPLNTIAASEKQAECLGFPHDKAFSYDGAADFCHKKSSPEAKQEES